MNAGGRLDEAIHSVRPPAELESRPYLRPVYDEPEFVVHTVWRLYGGWWDGNPATLKPAPERALAAELAGLAGGPGALAGRAMRLLADAAEDPGSDPDRAEGLLRLAGHLAEYAWLADPADEGIQRARHEVFAARAGAGHLDHGQGGLHLGFQRVRGARAPDRHAHRPCAGPASAGATCGTLRQFQFSGGVRYSRRRGPLGGRHILRKGGRNPASPVVAGAGESPPS